MWSGPLISTRTRQCMVGFGGEGPSGCVVEYPVMEHREQDAVPTPSQGLEAWERFFPRGPLRVVVGPMARYWFGSCRIPVTNDRGLHPLRAVCPQRNTSARNLLGQELSGAYAGVRRKRDLGLGLEGGIELAAPAGKGITKAQVAREYGLVGQRYINTTQLNRPTSNYARSLHRGSVPTFEILYGR